MSRMTSRSDTQWWDAFNHADERASRRRHPAGRARTPIDTAEDFHVEVDAQTGRVLPRQVLPDEAPAQPPGPPPSRFEAFMWGASGALASMLFGWVALAVFFGWEGLV